MIPAIHQHLSQDQIERLKTSWRDLLRSPLETVDRRDNIASTVAALSVPCDPTVMMHRVLALLAPYYSNDVPQSLREIEAEDWLVELRQFPEWALVNAARWWKGGDNPDRRKRPLEGDISARCKREIGLISTGRMAVKWFDDGITFDAKAVAMENKTPRVSAERAAEIMAEAGFKPRTFGGTQ